MYDLRTGRLGIYGRECAAEVSIYITGFVSRGGEYNYIPRVNGASGGDLGANELGMAGR